MSEAKGVYRTTASGKEVVFIDKGVGNPIGITRDRYEANGYKPPFDSLPEK